MGPYLRRYAVCAPAFGAYKSAVGPSTVTLVIQIK